MYVGLSHKIPKIWLSEADTEPKIDSEPGSTKPVLFSIRPNTAAWPHRDMYFFDMWALWETKQELI